VIPKVARSEESMALVAYPSKTRTGTTHSKPTPRFSDLGRGEATAVAGGLVEIASQP
jgi:hypothetical protein